MATREMTRDSPVPPNREKAKFTHPDDLSQAGQSPVETGALLCMGSAPLHGILHF